MSIITKIKSIFKKDLAKITAPLDRIYNDLASFLAKAEAEIVSNEHKAYALFGLNELIKLEHDAAIVIKGNIEKLLGNTPTTTTTVTPQPTDSTGALIPTPVNIVV